MSQVPPAVEPRSLGLPPWQRALRGAFWSALVTAALFGLPMVATSLFANKGDNPAAWVVPLVLTTGLCVSCACLGALLGFIWVPMTWKQRLGHIVHAVITYGLSGLLAGFIFGSILGAVDFAEDGNLASALGKVILMTFVMGFFMALLCGILHFNGPPKGWQKRLAKTQADNAERVPRPTYAVVALAAFASGMVLGQVCGIAFSIVACVTVWSEGELGLALVGVIVGVMAGHVLGALIAIGLLITWSSIIWVANGKGARLTCLMMAMGAGVGWIGADHRGSANVLQAALIGGTVGLVFGIPLGIVQAMTARRAAAVGARTGDYEPSSSSI